MNFFKDKIRVATHNGSFHADEVFALATLSLWAEAEGKVLEIARTRDEAEIAKAQIVVDVGMQYDPEKGRFDHHQKGGAGEHTNGVPYASFGLVWKQYGEELCGLETADYIEQKLVLPIDARDNGINISKDLIEGVKEYTSIDLLYSFRPTWQDPIEKMEQNFKEYLEVAKKILSNEIRISKSTLVGEKIVKEEIKMQSDSPILILDEDLPWERVVIPYKGIKLVIYPRPRANQFFAEVTRDDLTDYKSNRAQFPNNWRGLRGGELEEISGVKGAVFCHRGGFLAVANSREGALQMAQMALQEQDTGVK